MQNDTRISVALEKALISTAQDALDETIRAFDCQAGTLHWLDTESGMLKLAAQRNIPEAITHIVRIRRAGGKIDLARRRTHEADVDHVIFTGSAGVGRIRSGPYDQTGNRAARHRPAATYLQEATCP